MVNVLLRSDHADQLRDMATEHEATLDEIITLAIEDASTELKSLEGEHRERQLSALIRFLRGATTGELVSAGSITLDEDALRDFQVLIISRTGARLTESQTITAAVAWWLRPQPQVSRHGGEAHTEHDAGPLLSSQLRSQH